MGKFGSPPILLYPKSVVVGKRKLLNTHNKFKFKFCSSKFKIQALHSAQTHLSSQVSICLGYFLSLNYAKTVLVSL